MLEKYSTTGDKDWNKANLEELTLTNCDKIAFLAEKLFAEKKKSLLIILQGMDASGKDGLTRDVFTKVNPAYIDVTFFKKPNELELAHDFLWRVHKYIPEKGKVKIFNRSHYEDIIVPFTHGKMDKEKAKKNANNINDFEKMLNDNGVEILKFYMNISFERQEEKLKERIDDASKHWKHSDEDWENRLKWNKFMESYQFIFENCNKPEWHFIPSDKNWVRNYVSSEIVLKKLEEINPKYPALNSKLFS